MAKVRRQRYPRTAEGDELTPEVIDALAAEAERGYDLSKAKRVFISRPLLADGETWARVTIEIPNDELNRLRERAEAEGKRVQRVAREALQRHLDL
jgi:predicted DNA binding CopG/RHH family protein